MLIENFFFRNSIFFFISVFSDLFICYSSDNLVSNLTAILLICLLYSILFDYLIALLSHDIRFLFFSDRFLIIHVETSSSDN